MTDTIAPPALPTLAKPTPTPTRPLLPALVVLFVGSGCAALIYEIVWLQMLGLVIGQSAISLGVLLGTFMGGMCLGSLLLPKVLSRNFHPLVVYGVLELCIGAIGLLELWLMPAMGDVYTHFADPGGSAVALRAFMAGICLLPPTMLMGATLPAIARYVESSPKGVSWLGFFYGGNTLGAVVGCVLAGFKLLPEHDIYYATYFAAAINLVVAALAIAISFFVSYSPQDGADPSGSEGESAAAPGAWAVYVTLALSGLTGLGAEVIWTRQLALMLGATVYTFSNILAVFLLGLGIGSSVGSFVARSSRSPKAALCWCQFMLAASIAWAAWAISKSIPLWPIDLSLAVKATQRDVISNPVFQVNLVECFWGVLPGALLWGASFPIGLAALARRQADPGKLVGGLYAANTVGAIVGSLLFSLVMMQYAGSQNAQRVLLGVCAVSAIIAVWPLMSRATRVSMGKLKVSDEEREQLPNPAILLLGLLVAFGVCVVLVVTVPGPNWLAVAWGRESGVEVKYGYPAILHHEEALNDVEQKVLHDAWEKDFFAALDVQQFEGDEKAHVVYTLKDSKRLDEVRKWLDANEATLASALRKQNSATDEYVAVRDAHARGLNDIKLVNDQLIKPEHVSEENAHWIDQHRPALLAAMRKREAITGVGNLLPYSDSEDPKMTSAPSEYCVYVGEGMNVSAAVTYQLEDGVWYRFFHGAGKVQASSNPADMRLQRMLGHVTALSNYAQTGKTPEDVLVVACGAGVTAGSFVPYGAKITIVDIEPMVPRYVTPQFADVNHDVIPFEWSNRPTGYKKTNIVIDDGRHFMRTTKQKYDVITSDPIDPWVKGCAAMNTVEYYQMCKSHLKPGGIMALWIPFYESDERTSKSILATFFKVFPNGILWSNDQHGYGYDAVLFGSVDMQGGDGTLKLNVDKLQDYINDHPPVKASMQFVGFGTSGIPNSCEAVDILSSYAGTAPRLKAWTKEAYDNNEQLINTDRNLRLQYIAGLNINQPTEVTHQIFDHILEHCVWPDDIFSGSQDRIDALKLELMQTRRQKISLDGPALPVPPRTDELRPLQDGQAGPQQAP